MSLVIVSHFLNLYFSNTSLKTYIIILYFLMDANVLQGVPEKMQSSPFFPIFFQNSLSNIKNDFMVEENDIL